MITFEIDFISKESSQAEPEYMKLYTHSINALAPALLQSSQAHKWKGIRLQQC